MQVSRARGPRCAVLALCSLAACADATQADAYGEDAPAPQQRARILEQAGADATSDADAGPPLPGVRIVETEKSGLTCYRVTVTDDVHAPGRKFAVQYSTWNVLFRFRVPWQGAQFIRSIRPIADNLTVMHRSELYRQLVDGREGLMRSSVGTHPDGELLLAWSRPSDVLELPDSDGIEVPAGAQLALEHVYYIPEGGPTEDASGVELCVSPRPPARKVAVSRLGVMGRFDGTSVTGHCTPKLSESVEVRPLFGYTRRRGVNVKLVRTRVDGSLDTAFDAAPGAVAESAPLTLQPGEKLSVSCTYDGPVRGDAPPYFEACELLALQAPPGALVKRSIAALVLGPNTCID